ncbi:bifunctional riboflavin kinase/FAD synthetase [bacterium]|nr:bifunctional riboflavin kinase/FAD synthetase [bacterium]
MKLLHGFDSSAGYGGGFLSIGNFDGVHRGHQQMVACLTRHARERRVPAVVFTFDPHPIELLRPEQAPPALTSFDQKAELLEQAGVDFLIVYPTDLRLLNLSARDFFDSVVLGEFSACGMVEGPNFYFGHDREGTVQSLEAFCGLTKLELDIVPPVYVGTRMVSSSVIRELLIDGEIEEAAGLLGRNYRLRGRVARGSERGRLIGFPTANLSHVVTLLPKDGVYAAVAHFDGGPRVAAVNLGPNPTFGEHRRKLEAHLLDFDGDLYGQPVEIEFVRRIRDTQPFSNAEALRQQLDQDIAAIRAVVRLPGNR